MPKTTIQSEAITQAQSEIQLRKYSYSWRVCSYEQETGYYKEVPVAGYFEGLQALSRARFRRVCELLFLPPRLLEHKDLQGGPLAKRVEKALAIHFQGEKN